MNNSKIYNMKQIIFLALFSIFALHLFAQTVQGGGGICHTNGDPNSVTALTTQDVRSSCMFAVDTTNGTRLWYYKHNAASGSRWQLIDLSITDSDTRLDNPRVSGGNLVFDVLNVKTSTVTGTQTVAVTAIAPVQSVAGSTGISVTPSSGTYTVAPANDLSAVEALATNGLATRTGAETWAVRTITGTARVVVSNGDGVSGNPTIDLAQQSATTGQVLKWNGSSWAPDSDANSGGTVTSVGITAPAAGITVSNSPVTGAGNIGLSLANDLGAVEGITGTGVAVRTGTDTWTTREVTAGSGISVSNGTGVSGNIQITATDVSATNEIQTVDTFTVVGNELRLSLSSDGEAYKTVTLPSGSNIYNADGTLTGARVVTIPVDGEIEFRGASGSIDGGVGPTMYLKHIDGTPYAVFGVFTTTKQGTVEATEDYVKITGDAAGALGVNQTSPTRVVDINGDVRIRDLTTTAASVIVGADANGVLSSVSAGTNISISGGSISVAGSAADLSFSGSASPYTLNSPGTDVTFAEGAGISITRSSNELTIAFKEVSAKSQADAATQGVAVGGYFYASVDNTMGAVPGTKIRRMY